ncbi:hypothetical protein TA3x_003660 [Tundrisphaera sp. TA3]|uniref:ABC transporter permease n=1 Tax=Tundrisphaera sp. TA3 TaxID=3435775 RepID=UPI003EBF9651
MFPCLPDLIWAQTPMPGISPRFVPSLQWLYLLGEPGLSKLGLLGSLLTWAKVVSIFALIAWLLSWVASAFRQREKTRGDWLDIAALVALVASILPLVLNVLESTRGFKTPILMGGVPLTTAISLLCGLVILVWTERALWTSIRKIGTRSDVLVLAGMHLAIGLGLGVAYCLLASSVAREKGLDTLGPVPFSAILREGGRLGATYMGFVVLMKVLWTLAPELFAIRFRRLYAIAKHSILESMRRMWAPYVVIVTFAVILAFAHWFLPISQQRPAEMGRLFVGTLSLLCMLLLTVMVTVLAPLSLPQDIQMQTIYTIVSKPVRRIELIWGRILGYMTIVTALVLVFGAISLIYLYRNVNGTIRSIQDQAIAVQKTDPERARFLLDQAEQLKARMSARVPVKGSLTFIDSKGTPQIKGIDVGQELEYRSHVEGATPATAIWQYGVVPDPLDPKIMLDRRIPVESLLQPGTIEAIENQASVLEYGLEAMRREAAQPGVSAADSARFASESTKLQAQVDALRKESQALQARSAEFEAKAAAADKAGKKDEADQARRDLAALHSAPIRLEMTFTIYRTTKGRVGEPVFAELEVTNPRTNQPPFGEIIPIREYYTNSLLLPSSYLVGSLGSLTCKVRCVSPTQYLGMAESDFYILADSGNFGQNFMRGLFGIWLQAMVLTAIGVFAGTFLSWPVALLMTIAFFVAGHAAFSILRDFFLQSVIGGGPFESLIRLISHDNQVNEMAATPAVIVCKTLDSLVMPVMARMVYLIPNLAALDVSNTVAEGYAVGWPLILQNTQVALAYAIPFSIAGYFILKNREVAA